MKSSVKHRFWRYPLRFASSTLAFLTMFLLRDLLGIASHPFDTHAGWKPLAGWVLLLAVLFAWYDRFFEIFDRFSDVSSPDIS